jgi:hypothetical protein
MQVVDGSSAPAKLLKGLCDHPVGGSRPLLLDQRNDPLPQRAVAGAVARAVAETGVMAQCAERGCRLDRHAVPLAQWTRRIERAEIQHTPRTHEAQDAVDIVEIKVRKLEIYLAAA